MPTSQSSNDTAPNLAAEQARLDQVTLFVSPEAFDGFLAPLQAPAAPNERLRRTLQTAPLTAPP
jgi:uncharacterized protein (DUF1778 family)